MARRAVLSALPERQFPAARTMLQRVTAKWKDWGWVVGGMRECYGEGALGGKKFRDGAGEADGGAEGAVAAPARLADGPGEGGPHAGPGGEEEVDAEDVAEADESAGGSDDQEKDSATIEEHGETEEDFAGVGGNGGG